MRAQRQHRATDQPGPERLGPERLDLEGLVWELHQPAVFLLGGFAARLGLGQRVAGEELR